METPKAGIPKVGDVITVKCNPDVVVEVVKVGGGEHPPLWLKIIDPGWISGHVTVGQIRKFVSRKDLFAPSITWEMKDDGCGSQVFLLLNQSGNYEFDIDS